MMTKFSLGHLLYEMSYGQELFDAKPGKLHFEYCSRSVEVGEVCPMHDLKFFVSAWCSAVCTPLNIYMFVMLS